MKGARKPKDERTSRRGEASRSGYKPPYPVRLWFVIRHQAVLVCQSSCPPAVTLVVLADLIARLLPYDKAFLLHRELPVMAVERGIPWHAQLLKAAP